ncbi:PspC domain-containing protein [Streptomyces flavofungini]|uniref:PspC domain-containing protein n=1 Tax=Streptomyces flavofungini TaxID=68200 RepID=UPI0025B2170B|nr:PspC domain-containing protein [Streptomyces flavofungini]WJV46720.1 PspC domain-containing protein [Streptomyces flavofungini]
MTDQQPASGPSAPPHETATATAAEPGGPEAVREPKLRRDRRHRKLGGVCAGLGRHCQMDPVIFRIGLAVLAITSGLGLVFYGFAWLFVPYEDEEENEARRLLTGRVDGPALTAVLFALVGCGVFLTLLNNSDALTFAAVLALLLAGAGYWSQHRGAPDPDPVAVQAVADAPPETLAPPVTGGPSWWRDPLTKGTGPEGMPKYFWGPDPVVVEYQPDAPHSPAGRRPPAPEPTGPRGPRWLGGWVFVAAVLAACLGSALTWEDHPLGTSLQTGLACALAVLGLGIAASSFLGRTGAGSIVLAVITAGLVAGAAALPKNITTDWIRTDWRPATTADVRPTYEMGTGVGTLDLSRIDLGKDQTLRTGAEVGAGRLRVIVPSDAEVRLRAEVGVGDIQLPGDKSKDVDVEPGKEKSATLAPPRGAKDGGTIELRLEVGVGQVEVERAAS